MIVSGGVGGDRKCDSLLIGGPEEGRALSIHSLACKDLRLKQSYQSDKQRKRALKCIGSEIIEVPLTQKR